MKKICFLVVMLFVINMVSAQDLEVEKQAIKKVIQTSYVEGLQNEGDLTKIDQGIHPGFVLLGIGEEEEMWKLPIGKWKEKTEMKLKEGKLPRKENPVSIKFLSIDITGTAAVAKIEFYVGEKLTYIDYISLYKFKGNWKMVNKIFYKLPS
ncbi:putative lumazine-binding protein [Ancylomarina subtilis]|uniref:Putative lumazine-binding protein n=1 Tax=Ancylomarina subtilis TaxID=1639035 RepID=A0A4Q7VHI6_9BACT|nr:nuclear transport factor 2 family protein [Ancylomarina subtilis]RZT95560.1 putative lumazine-binding protein [Ancylomarina subtilis]